MEEKTKEVKLEVKRAQVVLDTYAEHLRMRAIDGSFCFNAAEDYLKLLDHCEEVRNILRAFAPEIRTHLKFRCGDLSPLGANHAKGTRIPQAPKKSSNKETKPSEQNEPADAAYAAAVKGFKSDRIKDMDSAGTPRWPLHTTATLRKNSMRHKIYMLVKEKGVVTSKDVYAALDCSIKTADSILCILSKRGIIVKRPIPKNKGAGTSKFLYKLAPNVTIKLQNSHRKPAKVKS